VLLQLAEEGAPRHGEKRGNALVAVGFIEGVDER
jgi:hypothetical protein